MAAVLQQEVVVWGELCAPPAHNVDVRCGCDHSEDLDDEEYEESKSDTVEQLKEFQVRDPGGVNVLVRVC